MWAMLLLLLSVEVAIIEEVPEVVEEVVVDGLVVGR